jgi:hypothetical protein
MLRKSKSIGRRAGWLAHQAGYARDPSLRLKNGRTQDEKIG